MSEDNNVGVKGMTKKGEKDEKGNRGKGGS